MRKLLENTFTAMLAATLAAAGLCYLLWIQSEVKHNLLPAQSSQFPWAAVSGTDNREGGKSELTIQEQTYSLEYQFTIDQNQRFPYAHLVIFLDRPNGAEALVNWSAYTHIRFTVRCDPSNALAFILQSFDPQVTDYDDIESFRPSIAVFGCKEEWQKITVNLDQLDTPEWWLNRFGLEITNQSYDLGKVTGFSLGNTSQSPMNTRSTVKIAAIVLDGRSWPLFIVGSLIVSALWLFCLYYLLRRRAKRLMAQAQERLKQASLRQNYEPLPSDTKRDKEKRAVMKLMATEFANPELDLETAISRLGINRTKLNAILKEETGMTFSACLNHLRLTEAARLLSETDQTVAEIAFRVGYNDASYFNRVFRKEFGCTPGEYKKEKLTARDN